MSSVRRRLLVGTGVGVGIALLIAGAIVFALVERTLIAQFDDALAAKARALSILVEQDAGRIEFDDISTQTPAGEYFELYSEQSLLRSKSLGDTHLERRDGEADVAGTHVRQRSVRFAPRGEDVEVEDTIARPLATFVVAQSTADLDANIARIRNILFGVALLALVLCAAILAWVARYGLAPVDRLAADIAAIRPDQLDPLDRDRPRELVPIVDRLNELLSRVDKTLARERALTADVAHELRTPLAGLRTTIEVALDRERTNERYRAALDECLKITTQTERMVASMLSLARLEAGVPVNAEPVAVHALIEDVLAGHTLTGITVTKQLPPTTLHTDPTKLASVLHNLVDNAVAYGDQTLDIALVGPTITVANGGCTLDDTSRIFDRFWRGDAARTAGTHAGLGLSICQTLVEMLGGAITATARDGRFTVTVVLPTSETSVDRSKSSA